jgi:hypothetical protein
VKASGVRGFHHRLQSEAEQRQITRPSGARRTDALVLPTLARHNAFRFALLSGQLWIFVDITPCEKSIKISPPSRVTKRTFTQRMPAVFDDILKSPKSLPDESAIAVHFKGGRGGILFGFDAQSQNLTPEHHILPHSGALAGYDVAAVVEEARHRAAKLADTLRLNVGEPGHDRSERQQRTADQAASVSPKRSADRWLLPLTRPLGLADGTEFRTLADVRAFIVDRLPDSSRERDVWKDVGAELLAAAESGDATDATAALEMVLRLEGSLVRL